MSGWALTKASRVGRSAFCWGDVGAPARPCHHSTRVAPVPTTSAGATVVEALAVAVVLAACAVVDAADDVALKATEATTLLDAADEAALPAAVGAVAAGAAALEPVVLAPPAPQAASNDPDSKTPAAPAPRKKVRRVRCSAGIISLPL